MSEDLFRIVITLAVALACLAFLVQAGVALALFRVVRALQEKVSSLADKGTDMADKAGPLIEKMGPIMQKIDPLISQSGPMLQQAGPAIDKLTQVLAAGHQILEDTRPRIAELSAEAVVIAKTGREQAQRLGSLLEDTSQRAQARLEQIDRSVDHTVEEVEKMTHNFKSAVTRPAREVNGIAAGISAAVSTLMGRSRKSSVNNATQDEEMFI